ncbi:hypothetical protein [Amnibacterium kyonggiense]|uniref:Transcriptional regulator with AbiEi antitoxin domain of type IV toxin-antitoxin system n=1 Tax=Amnibacterium kyonggiense TaxID=595671 RepID=A0A4R7FM23_9MICO|nr:hypothetical protein [Amnibacterium kyonggiense]TDS77481.1 hypothetical protein CLV52_2427 [Amnibacterium kyonggiense]
MPASPVLDLDLLSPAERSVLRLDGDSVPLGLTDVPLGVPVGPAVRAASLAPATARYDLVVELRGAAWVHGVVPALPDPLTLAVDLLRTGRRSMPIRPPREVRFRPDDTVRLGGVLVTTPLRTAFDLVRLEPEGAGDEVATALLRLAELTPPIAAALAQLHIRCPNKERAIERLAALPV